MKVNTLIANELGRVKRFILTETVIEVTLRMANTMEKGFIHGKMVTGLRATSNMVKDKERESIIGKKQTNNKRMIILMILEVRILRQKFGKNRICMLMQL